jgi:hypothetical protein
LQSIRKGPGEVADPHRPPSGLATKPDKPASPSDVYPDATQDQVGPVRVAFVGRPFALPAAVFARTSDAWVVPDVHREGVESIHRRVWRQWWKRSDRRGWGSQQGGGPGGAAALDGWEEGRVQGADKARGEPTGPRGRLDIDSRQTVSQCREAQVGIVAVRSIRRPRKELDGLINLPSQIRGY